MSGAAGDDQSARSTRAIARYAAGACVEFITTVSPGGELAAFLGGFVAAEGSFIRSGNRFRFAIALAATDGGMCELAAELLGVGCVSSHPRRKPHFDDEATFAVQSLKELLAGVVPFMDAYLPRSKKREQYVAWKRQLFEYWEHDAKRRRLCNVNGCAAPRRGKGLCRHHYYLLYRR